MLDNSVRVPVIRRQGPSFSVNAGHVYSRFEVDFDSVIRPFKDNRTFDQRGTITFEGAYSVKAGAAIQAALSNMPRPLVGDNIMFRRIVQEALDAIDLVIYDDVWCLASEIDEAGQ